MCFKLLIEALRSLSFLYFRICKMQQSTDAFCGNFVHLSKDNKMESQKSKSSLQEEAPFDADTILQLKQDFNALLEQEKHSIQTLNRDIDEHIEQINEESQKPNRQARGQQLLVMLRDSVCEKSLNIACLAQVGIKLIDYLLEQTHHQTQVCQRFETAIENLQYENGQLSNRNRLIQNDIEYFRHRLEATENQLENIVTQESEERGEECSQRDKQIQQLQLQLDRIKTEIERFKEGNNHQISQIHYKRTHSQQNLPQPEAALPLCLAQSQRLIEALQEQNLRLQRQLDASQSKVRSRRNSKLSKKQSIDYIPEHPGQETDRTFQKEQQERIPNIATIAENCDPQLGISKSAISLSRRANLLGEIKESLQSSNSCQVSNKLVYVSSNQSLFAHLQMQDLVRQESASVKCLRRLQLQSATMKEIVYFEKKRNANINIGTITERVKTLERSTNTLARQQTKKSSFLERLILKPVVDILLKMVWKSGSAVGCIG